MFVVVFYEDNSYRIVTPEVAQFEYENDLCDYFDSFPTLEIAKAAAEKEFIRRQSLTGC